MEYIIRHKKTLILILLVALVSQLNAQATAKDSLSSKVNSYAKKEANISLKDTTYINNIIALAIEERFYRPDSLYMLSKKSLALSKKVNYIKGTIYSKINIGTYYSDKGKTNEAISNFNEAYKLSKTHKSKKLIAESLNILSSEYKYQGNTAMALKGYLETKEIAEAINDKVILSAALENIAALYMDQKDYTQALVLFKQVKEINEDINNPSYIAKTMSKMSSAYADMNELEYAMYNINSSIMTFEKEKKYDWLAYAFQVKGKIYLKQQKNDWALFWYKQSELLHETISDSREEITLYNGMAEAHFNLGNDSISHAYATNAYTLSEKIKYNNGKQASAKLLYHLFKKKEDFKEALKFHEIYQKTSDYLSKTDSKKSLSMLKTKMEYDQQKQQLILTNEKALAKQKIYIYVSVIVLVVFFVLMLLIKRNERIQTKLNKKLRSSKEDLEKKEEYLNELNQTKNKLFSIIGHDLRGPIGALKTLLGLFKQDQMTNEEFLSYVPKLKLDIDNISFTLNNLLSWGQTQMNGATTKPDKTNLKALVAENIALLSEIASSKSINISNTLEDNTFVWADPNQVDIVVRNLLSNALKFTPEGGQITIGALEKIKSWEIYVRDNGLGMSEETMVKIFQKDANHTTYGTNDEKGTGLGLSLCLEMVEKNKGSMWVNSFLGKGSSFYFSLPKIVESKYQKSA